MAQVVGTFGWVLLRHELPDPVTRQVGWHFDWMIEQEGREGLVTFRVMERVDQLPEGATFTAERLADHRRVYLDYEGEISGGRGHVTRVASGMCAGWREPAAEPRSAPGASGTGSVAMADRTLIGRVRSGAAWVFEVV